MPLDPAMLPLIAPSVASLDHARAYARQRGAVRLDQVDLLLAELWRLEQRAGYAAELVAAQWADETGVGTSTAWRDRLNPGGIGITDAGDQAVGFGNGTDAARAMVVHLSAYVRGYDHALWPWLRLDPRYVVPLQRGFGRSVRVLADLGNGRWATNPNYAVQIAGHLERIRAAIITPQPTPGESWTVPAGIVSVGTGNWHERDPAASVRFLVHHITDARDVASGRLQPVSGVLAHFRNPSSQASAHFVIDRDGTIYQCVSTTKAAWTNGDLRSPRRDIPALNAALARTAGFGGRINFNDFCVTVEYHGLPEIGITEAQYARGVELARYVCDRWDVPRHRYGQLRHADLNSETRRHCPGPRFDLARLIVALDGDPSRLAA